MRRPLGVLCVFVIGCTSSAPSGEAAKAGDAAKAEPAKAEPAKVEPEKAEPEKVEPAKAEPEVATPTLDTSAVTPVYVMLGRENSRTTKPVANTLLGHAWGWGSASKADQTACEAKATRPGELMACATEAKPEGAAKLLDELDLGPASSAFVTPEQIASWTIAAPTGPVWLFGPTQACKATVGRPLVGWYSIDADDEGGEEDAEPPKPDLSDDFTVLELAWELTGCDNADKSWAPIGMVAATFDPTAHWVPMKAGERQRFDPATWTGLLSMEVAKLPDAAKASLADREEPVTVTSQPEWWTQTFELPHTNVREIWFAAGWRENSKTPDEYACDDPEFSQVFQIRPAEDGTAVIGRGSRGHLVGAVAIGAEVHSVVWTDSLDYQVAKLEPGGEIGDAVDLSTGVYHPESSGDTAYTLLPYCGP